MRDEAHVFSAGDADALRGVVARAPFDARLVTTSAYPDQAGFSRYVGSLVAEPNMVVVGIDPQHRHVQVHFGTGTHIPQAAWPDIEHAGNDAFKRGAWEEGGADVFRAAERAVTASGGAAVTPSASQGVSLLGPLVLVLLVGGVLVAVVMFARRRSQGFVGGGYGGPGYGAPGPYNGGGGPYYGPGGQPGGMGPLGGGIIGAGLGGLAGYELGKMEGERERERDFGETAEASTAAAGTTTPAAEAPAGTTREAAAAGATSTPAAEASTAAVGTRAAAAAPTSRAAGA